MAGTGVPGVPTWPSRLRPALAAARPGLLHGMRLTAAVCLALWITFSLELDAPFWAGTSAAISCQPTLGASRRKGTARLFGTLTGAVFVVLLAAAFPQSRYGFLLGIAVWGGACAFTATLLSNFSAYAASLSGYTVAIIAGDVTQSTNQVFTLAVSRASEIAIGIVCATIVVAGTDLGHARRELLQQLSSIVADLAAHLLQTLRMPGPAGPDSRPVRRDLLKRTAALDPVMDRAFGEVSDLRARQATLQAAVNGLFVAAAEWRTIDGHFRSLSDEQSRGEAGAVLQVLPAAARHLLESGDGAAWASDPATGRDLCAVAARACASVAAKQPSPCVTAERTAAALLSLAAAANGLALLADPVRARTVARQPAVWGGQDLLPPLVNAVRVFLTIASVALFWTATEWPGGQGAITFAFISVILLSPQNEKAAGAATSFAVGTGVIALWAGVARFALLPGQQTFLGLAGVLGLTLVPLGALATVPRLALMFGPAATNFMPLLAPTNIISYDTEAFYNSALSIVAGVTVAALAVRLIPPVPAATRTRNLLNAALAELRALATRPKIMSPDAWQARTFRRFAAMPDAAEPLQRAWLLAALAAGSDIILLRRLSERSGSLPRLEACLRDFAVGRIGAAVQGLASLDRDLAAASGGPQSRTRLRARSAGTTLRETLQMHQGYFAFGDEPT